MGKEQQPRAKAKHSQRGNGLPPGVEIRRRKTKTTLRIYFRFLGKLRRIPFDLPPTPENIEKCGKVRAGILEEVKAGIFDPQKWGLKLDVGVPGRLDHELDRWIRQLGTDTHDLTTIKEYQRSLLNFWSAKLGSLTVHKLTADHIYYTVQEMAKAGRSPKTITNKLSPLAQALDDILPEGIENPAMHDKLRKYRRKYAKRFQRANPREEIDRFTKEEQRSILTALENASHVMRWFFQFALWTGLRISEQIQLRWQNVDLTRRVVRIEETKTKGIAKDATKSATSRRTVELLEPAYQALVALKAQRTSDYVFVNPNSGAPFRSDKSPREAFWAPALQHAKVDYRPPKYTRHTYASMMLTAGRPLPWIANQMGHTITEMINIYGTWIELEAGASEKVKGEKRMLELFWD